jgi:hypothetical protein
MDDHVLEDLKTQRDICKAAGCHDEFVQNTVFEKYKLEMKGCVEGIKNTMQRKGHVLWEITKFVAIPVLTGLIVYYTSFVKLETEFHYFKIFVCKQLGVPVP